MYSLFCVGLVAVACAGRVKDTVAVNSVEVKVDACDIRGDISTLLTGVNIAYYYDTDQLWADGRIAGYLRDVKAGILRYPGGCETSMFHWETPYSHWKVDFWDPNVEPNTPTTAYMDTDDYIRHCRAIGAEPLIGVNLQSGKKYNRIADSVAEAVRWVKYCKDKNYNVRYWYLDNEPFYAFNSQAMTVAEYAGYIKQFVPAMRAVDPNIKIIANWNEKLSEPNYWAQWQYLLEQAGQYIDIADVHWYWDNGLAKWNNWITENPMISRLWCDDCNGPDKRYHGPTYIEEIQRFRSELKDINGLSHDIKLAALEWNVGKNWPEPIPSAFQCALMQAEMLGQFIEGGLDMACMWPLNWDWTNWQILFWGILDTEKHQPTPGFYVFKLYSNALGQQLVTSKTSQVYVRPVSARSQDGKTLWVYLLNKSADGKPVNAELNVSGFSPARAEAVALTAADLSSDAANLDKIDVSLNPTTGKLQTKLPPYSLTMLTFHKDI